MEGKKKSKSVTYEQKQLLIDFVHKHPKLNSKKFGPSFTMKDAQLLWQNITKNLNETVGPKKTWVEWRKCFQYLKSAAKKKVPSKSSFKKTGGGERDDEYIDQADEQLLDIIGPTAVHGHDLVNESTCMVSFVTNDIDPVQTLEETSTHNLISIEANPVEICVQENSNLELKDNNINFENCDKLNIAEKELELDPFDTYIRNNNKRHADVVKDIANYQKTYNKSMVKKTKLTNSVRATENLTNITADMLELKALYYKEKLKLKLREVEATEAIAENIKNFLSKQDE